MVEMELFPGPGAASDEDLATHCRKTVKTNYHPVGTCRMGRDSDPDAVVTPDLAVRGVAGLRIVDASIMPTIPSGNTNAPVLAIADKAADVIMGNRHTVNETRPTSSGHAAPPANQVHPL
jgi:choline dehydrogenase